MIWMEFPLRLFDRVWPTCAGLGPSILASILSAHLCAQQPQHYLLEETTIRSGTQATFEAAQKDYCSAVVRGGAPACIVFSPTTFSASGEYFTLIAFSSFAHYDEGTYTSKGLTPAQAAALRERREPAIASNIESGIALIPDVSYRSSAPAPLALITDLTIAPGTLPQLLRYLRSVEIPAARASGLASLDLYQVVAGGATTRFLLIRGLDTFAEMDKLRPFGEASERRSGLAPTITGCVLQVRTTIMRMRSDLGAKQ